MPTSSSSLMETSLLCSARLELPDCTARMVKSGIALVMYSLSSGLNFTVLEQMPAGPQKLAAIPDLPDRQDGADDEIERHHGAAAPLHAQLICKQAAGPRSWKGHAGPKLWDAALARFRTGGPTPCAMHYAQRDL